MLLVKIPLAQERVELIEGGDRVDRGQVPANRLDALRVAGLQVLGLGEELNRLPFVRADRELVGVGQTVKQPEELLDA